MGRNGQPQLAVILQSYSNIGDGQITPKGGLIAKMLVYVISVEGKPLMPCKPAKARKLLKNKKAKIVKYEPFTIQLLFECENQIQECVQVLTQEVNI